MIQKQREVEELETVLQQTHKEQTPSPLCSQIQSPLPPQTQLNPTPPCQDSDSFILTQDVTDSSLQQTWKRQTPLPPQTRATITASKPHQESRFQSTHHHNKIDIKLHQDSKSTHNFTHSQVSIVGPATRHSQCSQSDILTLTKSNTSPDSPQVISETQFQKSATKDPLSAKSEALIAAADEVLRKLRSPPPADVEELSTMEIDDDLLESSASLSYCLREKKTVPKRAKRLGNQTEISKYDRSRAIAPGKITTPKSTLKSPTISTSALFVPLAMKENQCKKRRLSPPEVKGQIYDSVEPPQKRVKFIEPVNCCDECVVVVTGHHSLEVKESNQMAMVGTCVPTSLAKEKNASRLPLQNMVELDSDDFEVCSPLSPNATLSEHHPFMSVTTIGSSIKPAVQVVPDTPQILVGPLYASESEVAGTTTQEHQIATSPLEIFRTNVDTIPDCTNAQDQRKSIATSDISDISLTHHNHENHDKESVLPSCTEVTNSTSLNITDVCNHSLTQGDRAEQVYPGDPDCTQGGMVSISDFTTPIRTQEGERLRPTPHTPGGTVGNPQIPLGEFNPSLDNNISTDSFTTPQHQRVMGGAPNERLKVVQTPGLRLSGEGTSTFRSPGSNKRHTLSFVGSGLSKPQLVSEMVLVLSLCSIEM